MRLSNTLSLMLCGLMAASVSMVMAGEGGDGGRGGRGGWGDRFARTLRGPGDANQAPATFIPDTMRIVENVVNTWQANDKLAKPDSLPTYQRRPETVELLKLVDVDEKIQLKVKQQTALAAQKAEGLTVKTGQELQNAYRKRIAAFAATLSEDDRKFLNLLLDGWIGFDSATRKVLKAKPPQLEQELIKAQRTYLTGFLKKLEPVQHARVTAMLATRQNDPFTSRTTDEQLYLFLGLQSLALDELFPTTDEGRKDKIAALNQEYKKERDALRAKYEEALSTLYHEFRLASINQLENEQDKQDLKKIAEWAQTNMTKSLSLSSDAGSIMRQFGNRENWNQENMEKLRNQLGELRTQLGQHRDDFKKLWPERFQNKIPKEENNRWGRGGRGGDRGGNRGGNNRGGDRQQTPGNDQKKPVQEEF